MPRITKGARISAVMIRCFKLRSPIFSFPSMP
ncbi:Uncharacterised protein [Vibrio cholerae]|nr:Uncharacterised protein [Vibrio cholerae]CSI77341.1 Uncharacterised protein [Vibrio cholerae]